MNRRKFVKNTAVVSIASGLLPRALMSQPLTSKFNKPVELLYNGIRLPEIWPPKNMNPFGDEPMPVPYLVAGPDVIPIDVGRQLFVDDFLIETTTLVRKSHKARKIDGNPILKAETFLEFGKSNLPGACPKDGGVWWDPSDKVFKMWYEAAWLGSMAYAESKDGIHWVRPNTVDGQNTNQILPDLRPDSTTVFLDHEAKNPQERFKMLLRGPDFVEKDYRGYCLTSPDGIRWFNKVKTGFCGDRTTMFYNPFRKKWVYSLRNTGGLGKSSRGRSRFYSEHDNFIQGADWNKTAVFWTGADSLDKADPMIGDKPQLYNLSAVGYESLMLGMHQIHLGPSNEECEITGFPKTTELMVSYSRDGFHWHRPDREAFIPATRKEGDWDRGYVQSVGGLCTVVGDELRFYYIGYEGRPNNVTEKAKSNMYANARTGMAVLRRDGFVSMESDDKGGFLNTKLVTFNGSFLFVNVDCPKGELKVEILDELNNVILPFSAGQCTPIRLDSTLCEVKWKGAKNISSLIGKKVRFRFQLNNGKLYSFWVSPDKLGASYGYMAAGGPGYNKGIDDQGIKAYKSAKKI